MFADSHTHSCYSFDGKQTVDELCESAVAHGISAVAITDHLDVDGDFEGYYTKYRAAQAREDVFRAKEKYRDKLKLTYGLELGQPYTHPEEIAEFMNEYHYEFIIGSLHNLVRVPDFSMIKFDHMEQELIAHLWKRMLDELENLLLNPEKHPCRIDTLGHITYPIRYVKRAGRDFDLHPYYDDMARIFGKLIDRGICLECNTSGIRQGAGMTFPDEEILRLYYDCGGRLITVGSDAHFSKDVGADIPATYDMLRKIGFGAVSYFDENGRNEIKL